MPKTDLDDGKTAPRDPDATVADPTMADPPGKPSGENVPPAGGESMAPADSKHPFATPGSGEPETDED